MFEVEGGNNNNYNNNKMLASLGFDFFSSNSDDAQPSASGIVPNTIIEEKAPTTNSNLETKHPTVDVLPEAVGDSGPASIMTSKKSLPPKDCSGKHTIKSGTGRVEYTTPGRLTKELLYNAINERGHFRGCPSCKLREGFYAINLNPGSDDLEKLIGVCDRINFENVKDKVVKQEQLRPEDLFKFKTDFWRGIAKKAYQGFMEHKSMYKFACGVVRVWKGHDSPVYKFLITMKLGCELNCCRYIDNSVPKDQRMYFVDGKTGEKIRLGHCQEQMVKLLQNAFKIKLSPVEAMNLIRLALKNTFPNYLKRMCASDQAANGASMQTLDRIANSTGACVGAGDVMSFS